MRQPSPVQYGTCSTGRSGVAGELGLVLLLTGGVSTLLVNGNPLLRFDGYYLLADWLEIPNLATRSRRAVLDALRTVLVGALDPDAEPTYGDRIERSWVLGYGVASSIYRTALMLSIAWWLSGRFFAFGVALAAFAVVTSVLLPLARGLGAMRREAAFRAVRPFASLTLVPAALIALALWLPMPSASVTRGVVWLPDEAVVRAASACEIDEATAFPGDDVRAGDVLFECRDPELALAERALRGRLDELDARLAGLAVSDPLEHGRLDTERATARSALADTRARIADGTHVAALDGRFDIAGTSVLQGRALARGDIAGYVVPSRRRTVRVAIDERVVGRLDDGPDRVEIRGAAGDGTATVHPSSILRRTPRAMRELPSAALGTAGGGDHAVDPEGDGRRLLEPVTDIELAWPAGLAAAPVGEHVGVRFVHAPAPLAGRLADALRRAFDGRGPA